MEIDISQNKEIFSGWYYTYYLFAILYLIFLTVFLIFTRREFCSSNSLRWSRASFIFLIVALLCKSAGYCSSGFIIIKYNKIIRNYPLCPDNYSQISDPLNNTMSSSMKYYSKVMMLSTSLPGYIISTAYCFIFFSWCSICIEVMEKKSSAFYGKSRCVLTVLLSTIIAFSLISIAVFFLTEKSKHQIISHLAEACLAVIRDILLSIAFIIYLAKMWQIFEDPRGSLKAFFNKIFCCNCLHFSRNHLQESINNFINYDSTNHDNPIRNMRYSNVSGSDIKNSYEVALILMCLSIIIGLIIRTLSIIAYTIITNIQKIGEPVCSTIYSIEFTKGYFIAFIVEILFSEIMPVLAIILHRISQPESQPRDTDLGF